MAILYRYLVEYEFCGGKRQNVHSKKWYEVSGEELEKRRNSKGVDTGSGVRVVVEKSDENGTMKLGNVATREWYIPNVEKYKEYIDVDGSKLQEYLLDGKRIYVHNSIFNDEVTVKAEIDIKPFFHN